MPDFLIHFAYFPIGLAVQMIYLCLMDSLLVPRFPNRFFKLLPAAVMALIAAFVSVSLQPIPRLLLNTALYLAVPLALYRGRVAAKLLAFAFWMVTYPCSESIALLIAPLWGWDYTGATIANQLSFDILCLLVIYVFYIALRSIKHIVDERPDTRLLAKLCGTAMAMMLCTFIILINSVHLAGYVLHPVLLRGMHYCNALGVFMPFFALHGLFSLLHRLNSSMAESEKYRLMEARAKRELMQTRALAERDERYRQLRHDFRNHLLAMDALAQRGEGERLREYIASLNAAFESSGQRAYCGNALIDGLFSSKELRMQQAGIEVHWRMRPAAAALSVSDLDLCSIIGNALDNAIEACERMDEGERREIVVSLDASDRGFFLQITNSCKDAQLILPHMRTRSQKRISGPGLGLASMQRIVDSCNGEMLIKAETPSSITLSIYIPA